ncbi:hypothetical protein [Cupriavidus basilensis]|nr:hypothetical protein [Cupriavidus basilensis]
MAELLRDTDALVARIETLDKELAGHIEQAVRDAAGKAYLAARLNLETMIGEQEQRLTKAGRHAAAQIGNQLNGGVTQIVAANQVLERKATLALLLLFSSSLLAGAIGGFLAALLIR